MTRIVSLWVKNFKSFGKATPVYFSDKLTGVVGPNGSGKSNILDAICFVLGRTATVSAMRARKGSELIFTGPHGTKPAEFGEVKIIIDNADGVFGDLGEQVTISRRVRGDGLSAYRVNGKRSTRNQVLDLLAMAKIFPDGHNIVLQGDIVGIIRRTPEERRGIIDEISGISEYEEKKHKAELEFGAVEIKIGEVNVAISERMRALEKLRHERDKAARYKRLQEIKGLFEGSITKRKIEERERNRQKLSDDQNAKTLEAENAKRRASEVDGIVWKSRGELHGIEEKLSSAQSQENMELVRESERIKGVIARKRERIAHLAMDIDNITRRHGELGKAASDLELSAKNLNARIDGEKTKHKAATDKRQLLEAEKAALIQKMATEGHRHDDDLRKINELETVASGLKSERGNRLVEIDRASDAARRKQEELESAERSLSGIKQRTKDMLAGRGAIEKKIVALNELLKEKKKLLASLEEGLSALTEDAESKKDELARLQAEVSLLRAGSPILKKIMDAAGAGEIEGVLCQVHDLIPAEGENRPLLSAAAGDPNAIIVDSKEHAIAVAELISRQNSGRVSVIFPSSMAKSSELTALASPKDDAARHLLELVFDGKVKAPTIADAVSAGNAVTPDGLVVEGNRLLTPPSNVDLFSANRSLAQAVSKRKEAEKNLSEMNNEISRTVLEAQKLDIELQSLKAVDTTLVTETTERIKSVTAERDSALSLKDAHSRALATLSLKIKSIEEEVAKLGSAMRDGGGATREQPMKRLSELDQKLSLARNEEDGCRFSIQELTSKLANVVTPELDGTRKTEKQLVRDKEAAEKERTRCESECVEPEKRLSGILSKIESTQADVRGMLSRKDELNKGITKHETEKYQLTGRLSALEVELASTKQRISEEEREIASLATQLGGGKKFLHGSIKRLQAKLQKVTLRLEKMGAVNLLALTEFDSAEGEFKETEGRKAKLESEKQAIIDFMNEIEKKKNAAFMENFSVIAGNFERVFGQLTGGHGALIIENPEHPLDGGLIIQASPKGKEVYKIESMSGGEQTLTALAFIFAIQEHKPAPFYVFDEVDAALDKDNSRKLANLLSEYSKKSQLVAITHNDPIMRVCNQLVGVYLRDGISHLVSATPEFLKKHLAAV